MPENQNADFRNFCDEQLWRMCDDAYDWSKMSPREIFSIGAAVTYFSEMHGFEGAVKQIWEWSNPAIEAGND